MKRLFALILAAVMMLALAACGNSAPAEPSLEDGSQTPNSTNVQSEPSDPADNATPDSSQTDDSAQAEQTEGGSNMLVAYFSLAVMVFFHGGSYGWGATSDPIYDGQNLVEKYDDIILVTVEYRTGIMGFIDFFSVEGGNEYEESGNLGLLDQVEALRWIQKNIAAFGGNPDNVTIWGESAGAGSVSLLPLINDTEGLFKRIIAESGSVALTYSTEECQNLTQMLLEETGCSTMSELMALPTETLVKVNEKLNDYNNFPERDGVVLPTDLYAAYETGVASDLDMLIGSNADEVRYWINEMGYSTKLVSGELIYRLGLADFIRSME